MATVTSKKIYRSLLCAVVLLSMLHGFVLRGLQAANSTTVDFFNMWGVIECVRGDEARVANIYTPDSQYAMGSRLRSAALSSDDPLQKTATQENLALYGGRLDAIASPLMYAFISGISSGNYRSSHNGYSVLCLTAFLLSMLMLGRILNFRLTATMFMTFLTLELYSPLVSDLRVGNVNCLQLLAVSLYIFLSSRSQRFPAGVVLALGVMLKPTTFMIAVVAAAAACFHKPFKDQYPLFAGMLCGIVAGFLAPLALFPDLAVWGDFMRSLPATLEVSRYPLENGNVGLTMLVNHLTGFTISPALYVTLFPLAIISLYRSSRGEGDAAVSRKQLSFRIVGYGSIIMLCSSSLVWLHYYTIMIPLMMYAVRPELWRKGDAGSMAARTVAVVAFLLFSTPVEQFVPDDAVYVMLLNGAVLGLAALLVYEKPFSSIQTVAGQG